MVLWQELVWSWLRFTLWGLADVLVKLKLLVAPLICLQAGAWCASASRQNLPLGLRWFRFHQCVLLPHRPGTSKGCIFSNRSQSTHTANHQGCSGQTFFIPISRGSGRAKLPGVAVRGLWAFTLWIGFAHYRPYPLSVLPHICLLWCASHQQPRDIHTHVKILSYYYCLGKFASI